MSGAWIVQMMWHDICFAHWRADAEALARRLPPKVEIDCFDGTAWVSVVPFRMTDVHARYAPTLPGFHDVPEINLRTYVRVGGVPGVWFFSLDAARPLVVESARITTGLPYFHAQIEHQEDASGIVYRSTRIDRRSIGGTFAASYKPQNGVRIAADGTLEAFLHERYHFFTTRGNRLIDGAIRHEPWKLSPIDIEITRNTMGNIIALPLDDKPDAAYFARALDVRAGIVRRIEVTGTAESSGSWLVAGRRATASTIYSVSSALRLPTGKPRCAVILGGEPHA
jgi:uncharacterized protein YqjF (DUF2071 family)